MSQRIGYRQELANRYLEYMRQAETLDQPNQKTQQSTPDNETLQDISRDGVAYRSASDALKPSLKNQLDGAFMQGRAQKEQELGAAELERRERSGERHSAEHQGVGLRRPLRLTESARKRDENTAEVREQHFERAVDTNEERVARLRGAESSASDSIDELEGNRAAQLVETAEDSVETSSPAWKTDADVQVDRKTKPESDPEVTRTDVTFSEEESAYRELAKGAKTASGEGRSIVDRERTATMVGDSHRASAEEKTRITRQDDAENA